MRVRRRLYEHVSTRGEETKVMVGLEAGIQEA
jgi:hypothetical protein